MLDRNDPNAIYSPTESKAIQLESQPFEDVAKSLGVTKYRLHQIQKKIQRKRRLLELRPHTTYRVIGEEFGICVELVRSIFNNMEHWRDTNSTSEEERQELKSQVSKWHDGDIRHITHNLSVRARKALMRATHSGLLKADTVDDFLKVTSFEPLKDIRNCGETTISEIESFQKKTIDANAALEN